MNVPKGQFAIRAFWLSLHALFIFLSGNASAGLACEDTSTVFGACGCAPAPISFGKPCVAGEYSVSVNRASNDLIIRKDDMPSFSPPTEPADRVAYQAVNSKIKSCGKRGWRAAPCLDRRAAPAPAIYVNRLSKLNKAGTDVWSVGCFVIPQRATDPGKKLYDYFEGNPDVIAARTKLTPLPTFPMGWKA